MFRCIVTCLVDSGFRRIYNVVLIFYYITLKIIYRLILLHKFEDNWVKTRRPVGAKTLTMFYCCGVSNAALSKLRAGQSVSIVAWGDEMTRATFLNSIEDRWQEILLRFAR